MTEPLAASWARTREHLARAEAHLVGDPGADLSTYRDYLSHNELGCAFECLVELGHDRDLPLPFWASLDRAAREMNLHTAGLHMPHLTSADLCRRHLAALAPAD